MSGRIVIFGYGPVGRATAARLLTEGSEVAIAQRNPPPDLADGLTFTPCDALNRDSVVRASRGARQFVVAIGLPYSGAVWRAAWPRAVSNFVAAAETNGARMVFVDNLYMYGPQTAPLVETMPLTDFAVKPAARAVATRVWMEAALTGRACVAALRAPDFYGPGVGQSYLGDATIGALAKGKAATFIGSPEHLHDYAYVPDVARAVGTLLAAPDSAFGQAWHVPCAPTRTTRQILEIAAEALGVRLRIHQLPASLLRPAGLFSPFLRELVEMRFQWDRPYCVIASRFAKAFWSNATPFETGVQLTALAFRAAVEAQRRESPKRRPGPPKRPHEPPERAHAPPEGGDEPPKGAHEPPKVAHPPPEAQPEPPRAPPDPPPVADAPPKAQTKPLKVRTKPHKGAREPPKAPPDPPKASPEALKPQPEPPEPQPENPKSRPEALKPQPEPPKPRPEALKPQPEPPKPQPEPPKPQPEPTKVGRTPPEARPEPPKPEPEAVRPLPEPPEPLPEALKGGGEPPMRRDELPVSGHELPVSGDEPQLANDEDRDDLAKAGGEPSNGGDEPPKRGWKWGKDKLPERRLQGLDRMPQVRSSWWSSLLRR